jgi:hypothetical protein
MLCEWDRRVDQQVIPLGAWRQHHSVEHPDFFDEGLHVVKVVSVGEDQARPTVAQDVADLFAMQSRIHWNRDEASVPNRVFCFKILGAVPHNERDSIASLKAERRAHSACKCSGSVRKLTPRRMHQRAISERWCIGSLQRIPD